MPFAMQNLGWKFYFINAAWNFAFLTLAYFTFVETKGLPLEAIATKFGDEVPIIVGMSLDEVPEYVLTSVKHKDQATRAGGCIMSTILTISQCETVSRWTDEARTSLVEERTRAQGWEQGWLRLLWEPEII
jgi:hypothetical protein